MLINELHKKGLINPPGFVRGNTHYLTITGSIAYGCEEGYSDFDIYGFCIPPKEYIFPHLSGEIPGFGKQTEKFDQWQQHRIYDPEAVGGKGREYDFSIYNIVKYFQLCMENNPNIIGSIFTPQHAVLHSTNIGNMVRENRKIFLHKGAWFKFKGYAYSQIHKMKSQTRIGKRKETVEKYGYDIKFSYHCVRLLNEVEQILVEHDLDLQRNREQLKSIRRGEWKLEDITRYFEEKENSLEKIYAESFLRYSPDENAIKTLLLQCLEEHYGNLKDVVIVEEKAIRILRQIRELANNY